MTTLTVGELFAGYGGLGLGLNLLTETHTAWVSDIDPGPRKVLAHRLPDALNGHAWLDDSQVTAVHATKVHDPGCPHTSPHRTGRSAYHRPPPATTGQRPAP